MTPEQHHAALTEAGLPEEIAQFLVALDGDTRNGLLGAVTDDLRALIGRPTTPMADTIAHLVAKPA
jgi:NAD(P)H dehydrogenase (quinone)